MIDMEVGKRRKGLKRDGGIAKEYEGEWSYGKRGRERGLEWERQT